MLSCACSVCSDGKQRLLHMRRHIAHRRPRRLARSLALTASTSSRCREVSGLRSPPRQPSALRRRLPASQPCEPPLAAEAQRRRNCSSQPLAPLPGSSVPTTAALGVPGTDSAAVRPFCRPAGSSPRSQQGTPPTQRVTQVDRRAQTAAPTQLHRSPRLQLGAGTASRQRRSSRVAPASSQLPRGPAADALDELDAELLRMLAEADLMVARRSTVAAPDPRAIGAAGNDVDACNTLAANPVGSADVAASDAGLDRPHPQLIAAPSLPPHHSAVAVAAEPLPAPALQHGTTQIQAVDETCDEETAGLPRATSVVRYPPDAVLDPACMLSNAVAAGVTACSGAVAVPQKGSGVFAGCSDEDDDVDWEAAIAAPPAGPCDAALPAYQPRKHDCDGNLVAEPPAGPDILPACAAAAAHATRYVATMWLHSTSLALWIAQQRRACSAGARSGTCSADVLVTQSTTAQR